MAGRLATGTLAARGASSPDALAAFIAGRARGGQRVLGFVSEGSRGDSQEGGQDDEGTCPSCGYRGTSGSFGINGGAGTSSSEALRTPAPSTGYVRNGAPLTVRGAGAGSGPGLANAMAGIELASPRYPVTGASDLLIGRHPEGGAVVRHRRGGAEIGRIINDGTWKAVHGGKTLKPHGHQRAALAELIGTWNAGTSSLQHAAAPIQPDLVQTPLMKEYGVPAIRALATPSAGSSDGPRMTASSAGSDSDDDSGLSGKSASVYKKLVAKGWDKAKAKKFAANASRFGGGD